MNRRIDRICDLLLGAAYADDEFHDRERGIIIELLVKLTRSSELPADLRVRIEAFDPKGFDVDACAGTFARDAEEDKVKLIELIAAVHEADDEFSFAEDDYLRRVGIALGIEASRVESLAFDFEIDELQDSLTALSGPK